MNNKKIKTAIYIIIGLIVLYLLYKLYINYENSNSESSTNTASTASTADNANLVNTNANYSGYISLAPINFNANNNPQNGILASYNSFVNDNIGNSTNENLQNEFLNNSSFTSSNPTFTVSNNNIASMNTPSINFVANSTQPNLIAGSNLVSNPTQDTSGQVMSQLVENINANTTLQKSIYAGDVIPESKL